MFKIYIQDLVIGSNKIEQSEPSSIFGETLEKFVGDVKVKGKLIKLANHYNLDVTINASLILKCDLTLEDFTEEITANLNVNIFDTIAGNKLGDEEAIYLDKDQKYIDITDKIYEEIILAIPMKKVAPEVRGKSLEEIFPNLVNNDSPVNNTWDALKNIKLINN